MYLAQQRVLPPTQTAIFSTILEHELDSLQQSAHESFLYINSSHARAIQEVAGLESATHKFVQRCWHIDQYSQPFFDSVLNPSILQWSTSCYEVISS